MSAPVNNPSHYTCFGGHEVIDIIDLIPEVTATRAVPKARKPGTAHEAKEAA